MTTRSLSQHQKYLESAQINLSLLQEKKEIEEEAEIKLLEELKATILDEHSSKEKKEYARVVLDSMLQSFNTLITRILERIDKLEKSINSETNKESLKYKMAVNSLNGFTSELENLKLKIDNITKFTTENPANQNGGKKKKRSRKTSKRRSH